MTVLFWLRSSINEVLTLPIGVGMVWPAVQQCIPIVRIANCSLHWLIRQTDQVLCRLRAQKCQSTRGGGNPIPCLSKHLSHCGETPAQKALRELEDSKRDIYLNSNPSGLSYRFWLKILFCSLCICIVFNKSYMVFFFSPYLQCLVG